MSLNSAIFGDILDKSVFLTNLDGNPIGNRSAWLKIICPAQRGEFLRVPRTALCCLRYHAGAGRQFIGLSPFHPVRFPKGENKKYTMHGHCLFFWYPYTSKQNKRASLQLVPLFWYPYTSKQNKRASLQLVPLFWYANPNLS